MNNINIQNSNNNNMMNTAKASIWNKISGSAFHLFVYVFLLILVANAANGQPCSGVTLACNNSINISTNDACIAEITLSTIMNGFPVGYLDRADYTFNIKNATTDAVIDSAPGTSVITVGDDMVGQTVKACVTLIPCGLTCWGYINIEDKTGPRFIDCDGTAPYGLPQVRITCEESLGTLDIDEPQVAVGCDERSEITFTDADSNVNCTTEFASTRIRTWYVSDETGNFSSCQQEILIERLDVNDIVFPTNYIYEIESDCFVPSIDPSNTGEPTGLACPNIMHFYTDIGAEICGLQTKLIRDWFVIDWCSGESRTEGQVIKIRDVSPPITVCPIDQTIGNSRYIRGTNLFDTLFYPSLPLTCSAYVTLDPHGIVNTLTKPQFVSDCSSVSETIEVSYITAIPGTAQPIAGPYKNLAQDADGLFRIPELIERAAWVRYCFTDECGNGTHLNDNLDGTVDPADYTNCCFFEISVSDNTPPTAICEGFTKVTLGAGGESLVYAESFDDNSYDPCGSIANYEVRRETAGCGIFNPVFGSSVKFCCADIGDTITVILRVTDNDGNSSECPTRVCVNDAFIPQFSCPNDVTIDCIDSYENLTSATGTVGCSQTYNIGNDFYDLSQFDSACNTGLIRRKIYIKDLDGVTIDSCSQNITVMPMGNNTLLLEGDYNFPEDVTVDVCDANYTINPDIIGFPTTNKQYGCINIGISYEDSTPVFTNTNGSCYTILRTWTVVDWCRYAPSNNSSHALYGTQAIRVTNTSNPMLECPDMIMVSTDNANCEGFVDLEAVVSSSCPGGVMVNWMIDAFNNETFDLSGSGLVASGSYPVGEHSITFAASNECGGGTTMCSFDFIVKGDREPLPICRASIGWTLNASGNAEVWASDFDLKSEGGCDGLDSLTFSFVPQTATTFPMNAQSFNCSDLANGVSESIPLVVYIVDDNNNEASCSVILNLQDSQNVCPDTGSFTEVGGSIMTETAQAVENVMVNLDDMNNNNSLMDMTINSGDYAFSSVAFYNDYQIKPEYDVDPLNGISTLDLVVMQRHILGIQTLDSPYKIIASDINNDGELNGIDLVELRKLILGIYSDLPQNDSWVFVPEAFEFANPAQPFGYDNNIYIGDLISSQMDADFVAVKVGDVNNSVEMNLTAGNNVNNRNSNSFYLSAQDVAYAKGELVAVPFNVEEDAQIDGLQFTLEFNADNLVFQGIDAGSIAFNDSNFALLNNHNGVITISIADANGIDLTQGDQLFNVYFESKSASRLSEEVSVTSNVIDSEIYVNGAGVYNLDYIFRSDNNTGSATMEVFQNLPNPFSESTRIAFFVPQSQNVTLSIYDAAGKLIHNQSGTFNKGINEFFINSEELSAEGILIYKVESETTSITHKMILVK